MHQQLLSGAHVGAYWLSNLLFDLIFYAPVAVFTLVMVLALNIPGLSDEYLPIVLLLLVLYPLQCFPLAYIISHLFSKSVTAQNMTRAFFSLTGVLCSVAATSVIGQYQIGDDSGSIVPTIVSLACAILQSSAVRSEGGPIHDCMSM